MGKKSIHSSGLILLLLCSNPSRSAAQDLTPEQVRNAIDKGISFIKTHQERGNWEHKWGIAHVQVDVSVGGLSCLAMLSLLESGVSPNDPVIQRGLRWLRTLEPKGTYVYGLQTMVFAKAEPKRDQLLIKRNVDWLLETARRNQQGIQGWSYPRDSQPPDNSNTQYAMLGLHAAQQAGVPINEQTWKELRALYVNSQVRDGGWQYYNRGNGPSVKITMTAAGVCGLLITGMELYKNLESIEADGTVRNCGNRQINKPLDRGLRRLGDMFTLDTQWKFYNLYGIERAGRLSGQRFFVGSRGQKYDWYRAGASYLVRTQKPRGNWSSSEVADGNELLATSFSLLFLAKGKTPVLVHKMMHGRGARNLTGDWNNDRNDVRNLTSYCSEKVFRKTPLTWQALDASKLDPGSPDSIAEMLQAPILYFNGHRPPYFTPGEKSMIKQYVDQGGFVLAEACCSEPAFDAGLRKLVEELWPDRKLEPLPPGHPIWSSFSAVPPGSFKLEGVDFGCKTGLVYAPQDISCYWESNDFEGETHEKATLAFRMGGNIVAYATGLQPPEDKLTHIEIAARQKDKLRRNFLYVGQINYGGADWQPAPNAMRNLMNHLRGEWGLDVVLQTKELRPGDTNLPGYKFLYMHGRRNFTLSPGYQEELREHLRYGGLLLADACCGSKSFDESFRKFISETFERDLEAIPLNDPLFSAQTGKKLDSVQCRTQAGTQYRSISPQLEGIRLDPDDPTSPWIVIYSKFDLGCALEKHHSPDCLGHSHESALDIAAQVVLYSLKE